MIFDTKLWDDFYMDNLRIYCCNSSDADLIHETLKEVYPSGNYHYVRGYDSDTYPYIMHKGNDHFCMSVSHEGSKTIEAQDFVDRICGEDEEWSCDISLEELL